jgi:glycerol-3-phosphate acyltransferase PlsY
VAVTCPRYNRVVLYDLTDTGLLGSAREIVLEGQPVAIAAGPDRLFVLQRPSGDARHIEAGYWETYNFQGGRVGSRYLVGMYPDDLVITPDGRHALVLTSGSAEGGAHRPRPALETIALGADATTHRVVGRVEFDGPKDDPSRLAVSGSGRKAFVALAGSNRTATIDLENPSEPSILEFASHAGQENHSPFDDQDDPSDHPLVKEGFAARLEFPGQGACLLRTRPRESVLRIDDELGRPDYSGRFPLRTALSLGSTRATGIDVAPSRGLIAVATRSGSLHLIGIRPGPELAQNEETASAVLE